MVRGSSDFRKWLHTLCHLTVLTALVSTAHAQPAPSPVPQTPSPMVDSTRPHVRVQKQDVAGKRFSLSIGTLYLAPGFHARPKAPLIVHFHGAAWLVEYHVMRAVPQAALITVQLGAGSGIYAQTFSEPARFTRLLAEARARLRQATGRDVEWSRVTLTSFSAGYGAVRSILQCPEHYARVDTIFLADSLHTSYVPEGKPARLDGASLDVFARFAEDAAQHRKYLWLTHSEVYPGTFASTTETADYLLDRLHVKRQPVLQRGPLGMQQLSRASVGNFHLAGYAGNSAPDHMDHLYALGQWLKNLKRLF